MIFHLLLLLLLPLLLLVLVLLLLVLVLLLLVLVLLLLVLVLLLLVLVLLLVLLLLAVVPLPPLLPVPSMMQLLRRCSTLFMRVENIIEREPCTREARSITRSLANTADDTNWAIGFQFIFIFH